MLGQLNQSMQAGTPAIDQVSGSSPNFDPNLQPMGPSPMPEKSVGTMMHLHGALKRRGIDPASLPQLSQNASGMVTMPNAAEGDHNPAQPGVQVPVTEAELIIKALTTRLGHHSKLEASIADALLPQPQQEVANA
jgi:hypothetical protein